MSAAAVFHDDETGKVSFDPLGLKEDGAAAAAAAPDVREEA